MLHVGGGLRPAKWESASEERGFPLRMRIRSGNPPHAIGSASGPGLRSEMMVGVPAVHSAPDAHPERKIHRRDGGMQSFWP